MRKSNERTTNDEDDNAGNKTEWQLKIATETSTLTSTLTGSWLRF